MSGVWTPRRVGVLAALLLPIVGTLGLIARGEVLRRGSEWRFPIVGYDPRDLLRGHYLVYRIEWGERKGGAGCRACCLCLDREEGDQVVSRVECSEARDCAASMRVEEIENLQRYFVPESYALQIEAAVRAGRGELLLSSSKRGGLTIKELLIDGKPWAEVIGRPADQDD